MFHGADFRNNYNKSKDLISLLNASSDSKLDGNNILYSALKSYTQCIDCFKHDERFDKMQILNENCCFYVCGKLFSRLSDTNVKIERLRLAINLKHKFLPILFGFDISNDGQEVLEIRKINFQPHPLTKQLFHEATKEIIFKLISQIIEFFNYISTNRLSISLSNFDDLISCCFIDLEYNLYFGNITYINVGFKDNNNLLSLGNIINKILSFNYAEIEKDIPFFWKQYLSICLNGENITKIEYSSSSSDESYDDNESSESESTISEPDDFELDIEENIVYLKPKVEAKFTRAKINNIESAREVLNKYHGLRYSHIDTKRDERFKMMKVVTTEDGKTIFIQKIEEKYFDDLISAFMTQIELVHSMILQLRGFSCDPSIKKIYVYRETNQYFTPIDEKVLETASDERRIQ